MAAYRLRLTRAARRDLRNVREWLTQPGAGKTASVRLSHIERSIADLAHDPMQWPVGEHPGVRERPVEGYRVMYRVHSETDTPGVVEVTRVFGPGQDRRRL